MGHLCNLAGSLSFMMALRCLMEDVEILPLMGFTFEGFPFLVVEGVMEAETSE